MPRLLAFDTSTETVSVGVRVGDHILVETAEGGAQSSFTLLPLIERLLAGAGLRLRELDAVVFGRGPGSFTGLRTACAVAQGLAFGAELPVLPFDTLRAVAYEAHLKSGAPQVLALLDARMDQVYAAPFDFAAEPGGGAGTAGAAIELLAPEAVRLAPGWLLAGNAFDAYGSRLPAGPRWAALPGASAMLRLAPALLAAGQAVDAALAQPFYVRDKVAQTTEERAALKAGATPSA